MNVIPAMYFPLRYRLQKLLLVEFYEALHVVTVPKNDQVLRHKNVQRQPLVSRKRIAWQVLPAASSPAE